MADRQNSRHAAPRPSRGARRLNAPHGPLGDNDSRAVREHSPSLASGDFQQPERLSCSRCRRLRSIWAAFRRSGRQVFGPLTVLRLMHSLQARVCSRKSSRRERFSR
ncbi:hypothetical protein C4K27_3790 [Pseudomonas chlororaphis subsp. chlororaphis]|nr:hypothetical protein C4K27_3790 [Pseudomonas chlororaphis subsp. chlororaphis]